MSIAAVHCRLDGLHLTGELVELAVQGPCQLMRRPLTSRKYMSPDDRETNLLRVIRRCVASTTQESWSLAHRWHGWPAVELGLQRTLEERQRVQAALRDMRVLRPDELLAPSAMGESMSVPYPWAGCAPEVTSAERLSARLTGGPSLTPPITPSPSCYASPDDTALIKCRHLLVFGQLLCSCSLD